MLPFLRAQNRFGLGARPGDRTAVSDPRGWLAAQLEAGAARLPAGPAPPGTEAIATVYGTLRAAQQSGDQAAAMRARRALRDILVAETRLVMAGRVGSARPFVERLVAFWSNHLCVSIAGRPILAGYAGAYEREVIRPHVLGRFADMVQASARHPAMLIYLDNGASIGPGSPAARRPGRDGRQRGLNENYARELLELHTVGVDGGYTQDDVRELARVLTGWGLEGPAFRFRPAAHEPGPKTVMGRRYQAAGEREGQAVIRDLARHPSTARFLATKLVRHFVADDPPAEAVAVIEQAWRDSDGNLHAVAHALVDLDAAWDERHRKFRTPQDWLVAMLRAMGAEGAPEAVADLLRQLRQPLWAPEAPKGYGDTMREWADPDALMNRAELARRVARQVPARSDPRALAASMDLPDGDPLPALLADETIPAAERAALAFAGPAFQWR